MCARQKFRDLTLFIGILGIHPLCSFLALFFYKTYKNRIITLLQANSGILNSSKDRVIRRETYSSHVLSQTFSSYSFPDKRQSIQIRN